jgi:hypothetical protein
LEIAIVESAVTAAKKVLEGNRRSGISVDAGESYDYVCPSPETYPFQWAWDSCFHAIALTRVDPHRAQNEIDSLLRAASPNGFIPHMVLWQDDLRGRAVDDFRIAVSGWRSVTIAPPVIARAIECVVGVTGDVDWLNRVYPIVVRFFEWIHRHRLDPETGLVATLQPDESGLDVSPKYDVALGLDSASPHSVAADWHDSMRRLLREAGDNRSPDSYPGERPRFLWNDVLLNSIYADGLRSLARLAPRVASTREYASVLEQRAVAITHALLRQCWDSDRGVFWDLDLVRQEPARVVTSSCLLPLLLEDLPSEHRRRLIDDHLLRPTEFWLPFPIPSVAANEPSFDPDFSTGAIFRGSSWMNLNWYLYQALRRDGYGDIATELAHRSIDVAALSGMRECYGPYDGLGHGARDFGWSCLVLDLVHEEGLAPSERTEDVQCVAAPTSIQAAAINIWGNSRC